MRTKGGHDGRKDSVFYNSRKTFMSFVRYICIFMSVMWLGDIFLEGDNGCANEYVNVNGKPEIFNLAFSRQNKTLLVPPKHISKSYTIVFHTQVFPSFRLAKHE